MAAEPQGRTAELVDDVRSPLRWEDCGQNTLARFESRNKASVQAAISEESRYMPKPKRKLTAAERRARKERKKNFMTIFINGKQKRVPRPQLIDGLPVDEFIARNADPIWLHQNEMWELMPNDDESPR
jgi:hypothetical protein